MIQTIRNIASQLQAVYPADEAEALAWWVVEEETGLNRTQLQFGCKDTAFLPNMQEKIDRLLHFEPIQYIFGHTLWNGLDLKVTPDTLIPRPETAELVNLISNVPYPKSTYRVLDIGTGSGCIAIALKKKHPEWQITGIDISTKAIEVAKENSRRNNTEVEFLQRDIFSVEIESFRHGFDIVVSNPPYICEREKQEMRRNVLDYEPASALFVPDNDPLVFYRRICLMRLGTHLFFEINETFAKEMEVLLQEQGYTKIRISQDMYGKPRMIEGHLPTHSS